MAFRASTSLERGTELIQMSRFAVAWDCRVGAAISKCMRWGVAPRTTSVRGVRRFLNDALQVLWPAFDRALGALLKAEIEPLLRASSPAAVDGASFEAFSFGATPMQVPVRRITRRSQRQCCVHHAERGQLLSVMQSAFRPDTPFDSTRAPGLVQIARARESAQVSSRVQCYGCARTLQMSSRPDLVMLVPTPLVAAPSDHGRQARGGGRAPHRLRRHGAGIRHRRAVGGRAGHQPPARAQPQVDRQAAPHRCGTLSDPYPTLIST